MADRKKWNVLDPGDAEIEHAWAEWRFAVSLKKELAADQWRQLYLALVERRDRSRQSAGDAPRGESDK